MRAPTRISTTKFSKSKRSPNSDNTTLTTSPFHMKFKLLVALAQASLILASCDTTTDTIGSSIIENQDGLQISAQTFSVSSRSLVADSVLSRNTTGYLGKVRDPETNTYIVGDFMAQFNSLEGFTFPEQSHLVTYDDNGKEQKGIIKADSCELRLFYSSLYGDSTQLMKLTAYEMGKAMNEDRKYYSNFSPLENGYIREDGLQRDKVYSLIDYNVKQSTRDTSTYTPYITIKLKGPYTDNDGNTYDSYGTYIMRKYYDNPANFKDAYAFRNNVVPGFFFKHQSGVGNMAYVSDSQLDVYFSHVEDDSLYHSAAVFWGTEEVLQTSTITNDKQTMERLAQDTTCTYLKTPAGIFTELTLPVEKIMSGHENDTITSAKLVLQRLNNKTTSDYAFDVPKKILMIPADSLHTFFENNNIYNNKNSYVASWAYSASSGSFDNSYTFNNISGMVSAMYNGDRNSANWNKVVIVPVEISTTTTSSGSATVVKVTNDMSLTSTRLVKGTDADDSPIKLNVIYSRFK